MVGILVIEVTDFKFVNCDESDDLQPFNDNGVRCGCVPIMSFIVSLLIQLIMGVGICIIF